MRRRLLLTFVAAVLVVAVAAFAGTVTLRPDAGVVPVPTGITFTKFPAPVAQRDPLAYHFLAFDALEAGDISPRAAGTPVATTWVVHRAVVRADTIVRLDEDTPGRVRVYLVQRDEAGIAAQTLLVRGNLTEIQAVVAQSQGVRVVAVTFDETR